MPLYADNKLNGNHKLKQRIMANKTMTEAYNIPPNDNQLVTFSGIARHTPTNNITGPNHTALQNITRTTMEESVTSPILRMGRPIIAVGIGSAPSIPEIQCP